MWLWLVLTQCQSCNHKFDFLKINVSHIKIPHQTNHHYGNCLTLIIRKFTPGTRPHKDSVEVTVRNAPALTLSPPCFDLFSQTKMSNYFLKLWFVFSNKDVQLRFEALICFLKQRCPTIFWSFDLFSLVRNALTSPCFFYFFSQTYSELNFVM